jgi:hypothetical protein
MHCDDGGKRDDWGQGAPRRCYLWLLVLAFCMNFGYIANVEVCASIAIRGSASACFPGLDRSDEGNLGASILERPLSREASDKLMASVRPNVMGVRSGENH